MNLLFRFFFVIFKNLVFKRPLDIKEKSVIKLRVLPTDLDLNFHMNNGRYLTIMDIGRMDLTMRIKGMAKLIVKEKLSAVAAGVNITYFKPLNPFSSYELHSYSIAWDDHWFFIKQDFKQNNKIMATAIAKVTFLKGGKRINPKVVLDKLNQDSVSPEFPEFLSELITGEKKLITTVKEANKA